MNVDAFSVAHERKPKNETKANGYLAELSTDDDGIWIDDLCSTEPVGQREWIVKPYLLRGNVTSLFGLTSLGKSTLGLTWACLLALKPSKVPPDGWSGFKSPGGLRVLLY